MKYLEEWLDERKVDEVECLVPDMNGIPRGKILPALKFTKSTREYGLRLPDSDLGDHNGSGPRLSFPVRRWIGLHFGQRAPTPLLFLL